MSDENKAMSYLKR